MDYKKIRIKKEEDLSNELFNLIEGKLLKELMKKAKVEEDRNEWKFVLEGHSFKVTDKMFPKLYEMFSEVIKKLDFKEKIELFVSNSSDFNASSSARLEKNQSHLIVLNSTLIQRMDEDELKFIIGHEIGHLTNKNAEIMKLIRFMFPDFQSIPIILYHKIELWEKLSELSADRYGYIASPNIKKIITGFFKLASGLDTERVDFDYNEYLKENDRILEYFRKAKGVNLMTHPINPIRIKALQFFADSELYAGIESYKNVKDDKDLNNQLEELTKILLVVSGSKLDYHRKYFIASAGLLMAKIDEEVTEDEIKNILNYLSDFTIFPKDFLGYMMNNEKIQDTFVKSTQEILRINPAERGTLIGFLINMALADNKIANKEIEFVQEIGKDLLGFNEKELAQIIARTIQERFMPNLYGI